MSNKILAKAHEYAAHGMSIMPVGKDKRPLLGTWKALQETPADEVQIEKWFDKPAPPNIGIITGKVSGIIVVDVDTYKGAKDIFPDTFTVQTGNGGIQKYYKYVPGFTISANGYPTMPHVDLRADGGFVVASPSITNYKTKDGKKAGGAYTITSNIPLAPFPARLFPAPTAPKKPVNDVLKGFNTMAEGDGRNAALTRVIGKILKMIAPVDHESVAWPMSIAANGQFKEPLDKQEVRTIFNSIAGKEKLKPLSKVEFLCTEKGAIIPNVENVYRVLTNDPELAGKFRVNTFAGSIECSFGRPKFEPFQRVDIVRVQSYLMSTYPDFTKIPTEAVEGAMARAAEDNRASPPVEWLKTLVWDETPRLDSWLTSTYGVPQDVYHVAVGANWLKGLVKRLVEPGCKFDYVLVLEGKQGIRKSTSLGILGGDWHVETIFTPDTKDFFMLFANNMIVEFSEGETLSRTEAKQLKAVITMQNDKFRPPYDRSVKTFPRQCVFAMTTNQEQYLKDESGNRRWLPVAVKQIINTEWLQENRDQLFAEAYHRVVVLKETTYEFPAEETAYQQGMRQIEDPRTEVIVEWYYNVLTDEHRAAGITARQAYIGALQGGFESSGKQMDKADSMIIGGILREVLKLQKSRLRVKGTLTYLYFPTPESEANKADPAEREVIPSNMKF